MLILWLQDWWELFDFQITPRQSRETSSPRLKLHCLVVRTHSHDSRRLQLIDLGLSVAFCDLSLKSPLSLRSSELRSLPPWLLASPSVVCEEAVDAELTALDVLIGAVMTSHLLFFACGSWLEVLDVWIAVLIVAVKTNHLVLAAGSPMLLVSALLLVWKSCYFNRMLWNGKESIEGDE